MTSDSSDPNRQTQQVVVVGGGLAGIAAALAIARQGLRVSLYESRPRLGGRASFVEDRTSGDLIDNCQHVSMGCCVNFQQLCRWAEADPHLVEESRLHFIARDGKVNPLRAAWLPAPMHLLPSFLSLSYLTLSEKGRLMLGLRKLLQTPRMPGDDFAEFLKQCRQPESLIERFWKPVLVSALSEDLEQISYRYARQVFCQGFFENRQGWTVQLLNCSLGYFYDHLLTSALTRHQVEIHLNDAVKKIEITPPDSVSQGSRVCSLKLASGKIITAADFVVAVPPWRVGSLFEPDVLTNITSQAAQFETAPIASVHLWFDRPITTLRHAVLMDRVSQWMFNRTAILTHQDQSTPAGWSCYQVVISNARELKNEEGESAGRKSSEQIIEQVVRELAEIWPEVKHAELKHARLITDQRAVFSPLPMIDQIRPHQQTEIPNLQLAGDWTETGWPATMEGAVRSGFLAARNILRQRGLPSEIMASELPAGKLSRILIARSGPADL